MSLASAVRSLRRRPTLLKPHSGYKKQRLSVEVLEERLPPGDAVFAGLLAQAVLPERATGLIPVVPPAAPPGQARRLAVPASFDLAADLTLVTDVLASLQEAQVRGHAATVPGPLAELEVLTEEPVALHKAPLGHADTDMNPHLRSGFLDSFSVPANPGAFTAEGASSAPERGDSGVLAQPRSLAASANYQLDQAVAALVFPTKTLADDEGTRGAPVRALFNLGHPNSGPFPSNWFTTFDDTQNTWRRVNLPYPDCSIYVSDCEDIAVLNELDGFNLQPRLSIPFSGPIDVHSVNYTNVFLVSLGSTTKEEGFMPRGYGVGINQVVWDVETNTLHVESDELLAQHTRFALYATTGVRDTNGNPVEATEEFRNFRETVQGDYREHLHDAMLMAGAVGLRERDVVAASVFTTQSATAVLEKIRDQVHAATPEPADFLLGPKGERALFNLEDVTGIRWDQQTRDNPPQFSQVNLSVSWLRDNFPPGTVGQLAFGKYMSPNYLTPEVFIPPVGTRAGTLAIQGWNEIYFNLILPSGSPPPGGWPVAIVGHGGNANKNVFILRLAASNAARGIATVAINKVGNGFGPLGTLTVSRTADPPLAFPDGGRGRDMDGDGVIGLREGENALAPRQIIRDSDGYRQAAADLMQLVRVIEVGVDVDGHGGHDLNPSRIYFFGTSAGGFYGTPFLAVEPSVRVGALNVTGGSVTDVRRVSPAGGRSALGSALAARVPPLLNAPGVTEVEGVAVAAPHFNENRPLRSGVPLIVRLAGGTVQVIQAPVVNTVPGAMAIQQVMENSEWVALAGDPLAYIPHLRKAPLPGVPTKSVLIAFSRGDQNVANPGTTALLRAGDLADRCSLYRHDLAYAEDPRLPKDGHTYLPAIDIPAWLPIALGAQSQLATFFASHGQTIIHPEPARFFEVPVQMPLPEELNYIA